MRTLDVNINPSSEAIVTILPASQVLKPGMLRPFSGQGTPVPDNLGGLAKLTRGHVMGTRIALLAALVLVAGVQAAQEPELFPLPREAKEKQEAELLPLPREVPGQDALPAPRVLGPMPFFPYAPPDPPPQFGRRDVWQYFSVNSRGQFVPRVVYGPHGAYYLYNGRPFPYTTTQPQLWDKTVGGN